MSEAGFATQIADWERRRPELTLAIPYIAPDRRKALVAFAAIAQQWQDDVAGIAEASVLEAKFAWWADEIAQARAGSARHPLSAALFAWQPAHALADTTWLDAIHAGLALRELAPPADFAAQLAAIEPFAGALARLESALWFGAEADPARATRLVAAGFLADALPAIGHAHGSHVLPMQLMARHQLDRAALATAGAARDAAVRDQARALHSALDGAMSLPGPISLFLAAGTHALRRRLRRATRARAPLAEIALASKPGALLAWRVWRDARMQRAASRFHELS